MKTCTKCNKTKELDDFYKKLNRLHSFCKECFNSYCINRWKERKKKAVEYKGGKCASCGYNKCISALSFHHKNPELKSFTISGNYTRKWESLKEELDKCILLCLNCHAELHFTK